MNWLICELSSLVRLAWQPCNTIAGHNGCGYCLDMKVTIFLIDITASFCIIQSLLFPWIFPHIFVWVLVFGCLLLPPAVARRRPHVHTSCPHTTYSHTTCTHRTCHHTTCSHTTCTHRTCHHTTCSHTTCPHIQIVHTQLTHTHNLTTHNFLTHNLHTHTQLVTTQLAHTHNLSTHNLSPQVRGRRGTW